MEALNLNIFIRLIALLSVTLIGLMVFIMGREFWATTVEDFRPNRTVVALDVKDGALGFSTVHIPIRPGPGRMAAFYRQPKNGKVVILLHGSGANRGLLLPEARFFAQSGFGVLVPDLPGHGQSDGKVQWGSTERPALREWVAWLIAQPECATAKISLYGFSFGSMVAVQYAAMDQRMTSVVLAGSFGTFVELFTAQAGLHGFLYVGAWLGAYIGHGVDMWHDQPIDLIASIAPRPLLFISGSNDRTVPSYLSDQLFDAALPPKRRAVLMGANHGTYIQTNPEQFSREILEFYGSQ